MILYRAADANVAMMKEKTLDNTLAASQNSANIETEMRSIAQQLNRLQDVLHHLKLGWGEGGVRPHIALLLIPSRIAVAIADDRFHQIPVFTHPFQLHD